ncbi:MAG: squalene--hopene cyclase [Planctomycetes bacterium]|nr:squalene--hopene cyclase [Planctomycetota bacterium]
MEDLHATLDAARARLIGHRTERGSFVGRLSSSALSTATASMACELASRAETPHDADLAQLARNARGWLALHQNEDGGWGDTTSSPTNVSTTTLCWVALGLAPDPSSATTAGIAAAERWLQEACGGTLEPRVLARTIRDSYGKDRTFSVPILTTCALGGRLGEGRDAWREVPSLPFELAALPHQLFQWLGLPMVSYALPALIAIGQVRHYHRPTWNPITRLARRFTGGRTLRILREIQPTTGGYLEAAPLTSFVTMSLVSMGLRDHPVVTSALDFLSSTVREDGSWPIDTNLDTWLTTLSTTALDVAPTAATMDWLLDQHHAVEHPYTHAAPGGWAWTDLPGGVPDADDTASTLLALERGLEGSADLEPRAPSDARERIHQAATAATAWLRNLQNRDGGIPTFCRGWGKLPFDRSSPDITAHAVRAWTAWRDRLSNPHPAAIDRATAAAIRYLVDSQRDDGAWIPLWFGNQSEPNQENPLYGTTRVLRAVITTRAPDAALDVRWRDAGVRGLRWILDAQQESGGFGGARNVSPSVEETALALETLAAWDLAGDDDPDQLHRAIRQAAAWLIEATDRGTRFPKSAIGLYFAKLWYSEELYPLIFTVSALIQVERCLARRASGESG